MQRSESESNYSYCKRCKIRNGSFLLPSIRLSIFDVYVVASTFFGYCVHHTSASLHISWGILLIAYIIADAERNVSFAPIIYVPKKKYDSVAVMTPLGKVVGIWRVGDSQHLTSFLDPVMYRQPQTSIERGSAEPSLIVSEKSKAHASILEERPHLP